MRNVCVRVFKQTLALGVGTTVLFSFLSCAPGAPPAASTATNKFAASVIGTVGGTITLQGLDFTIPAGSLSAEQEITITARTAVPDGYGAFSMVYEFGPSGLTFNAPVIVSFPVVGNLSGAVLYWSNESGGYDIIQGTLKNGVYQAEVSHFSEGFLGPAQCAANRTVNIVLSKSGGKSNVNVPFPNTCKLPVSEPTEVTPPCNAKKPPAWGEFEPRCPYQSAPPNPDGTLNVCAGMPGIEDKFMCTDFDLLTRIVEKAKYTASGGGLGSVKTYGLGICGAPPARPGVHELTIACSPIPGNQTQQDCCLVDSASSFGGPLYIYNDKCVAELDQMTGRRKPICFKHTVGTPMVPTAQVANDTHHTYCCGGWGMDDFAFCQITNGTVNANYNGFPSWLFDPKALSSIKKCTGVEIQVTNHDKGTWFTAEEVKLTVKLPGQCCENITPTAPQLLLDFTADIKTPEWEKYDHKASVQAFQLNKVDVWREYACGPGGILCRPSTNGTVLTVTLPALSAGRWSYRVKVRDEISVGARVYKFDGFKDFDTTGGLVANTAKCMPLAPPNPTEMNYPFGQFACELTKGDKNPIHWKATYVSVTPEPTPVVTGPNAPTGLSALPASESTIQLAWTDTSEVETGFKIERSLDANLGWTQIAAVGSNVVSFIDPDRVPYTTYFYRVYSTGETGNSTYSNVTSAMTVLNPPTALAATAVSATQINLTWTENSSHETGIKIERSPDGMGNWVTIATLGRDAVAYSDGGRTPTIPNYYRVYAFNAGGNSAFSNTASATTVAPSPTPVPTPTSDATPTPTSDATPTPTSDATPTPTSDATPTPTSDATPSPTPQTTPPS